MTSYTVTAHETYIIGIEKDTKAPSSVYVIHVLELKKGCLIFQ
jgi:hypothetical protein